LHRSQIEWVKNNDGKQGFTSNPVKGECPVGCSYCYVKSFRGRYGWHKDIRFYPAELEAIRRRKKPARIFVGSTIELFHDKTIQYMPEIMETVKACPRHTIMFLTKQPQNLPKSFPKHCYVGVSITTLDLAREAITAFAQIEARIKFASYEPCYDNVPCHHILDFIDWLIIGSQTKPFRPPSINKVEEIVRAADQAGVKVFLKDNLKPLFENLSGIPQWAYSSKSILRQEIP